MEEKAARQLRKEVGRLLRHHLPTAGTLEHVFDPGCPKEKGALELARIDAGDCLLQIGCVADSLVADQTVDELDVELTRPSGDRKRGAPAVADRVGRVVGEIREAGDGGGRWRRVTDRGGRRARRRGRGRDDV